MFKKIFVVVTCAIICGCGNSSKKHDFAESDSSGAIIKKENTAARVSLQFSGPEQIDNSPMVMYQLYLSEKDRSSASGSFISKSDGRTSYWNIIFLNTETRQYHLLDSLRKMVIHSVNADRETDESITATQKTKSNSIFYSIVIDDANKDGKLDDNDPDYVFISDKAGNNLKQISPTGYDVKAWKLVGETNKVLMETVPAKKQKDENVELVFFIYDMNNGNPPQKTFSADFLNNAKILYNRNWPTKE